MSSVIYTDRFIDDVAQIYSDRVLETLERRLEAIESFPTMGSSDVRPMLTERYGESLRRFPVPPFVIIYRYREDEDRLEFLALPYDKTIS